MGMDNWLEIGKTKTTNGYWIHKKNPAFEGITLNAIGGENPSLSHMALDGSTPAISYHGLASPVYFDGSPTDEDQKRLKAAWADYYTVR